MHSTVTFKGNLADDVTIKENRDGGIYLDCVVLVNQPKDQGKDRPATRWAVRITGRTAENAANLKKGTGLLITGSIVTDSWTDKATGENRYAQRVLAQAVGIALTFAQVNGIQRTSNRDHNEESG
jgi:single-strand DNA-binding protein